MGYVWKSVGYVGKSVGYVGKSVSYVGKSVGYGTDVLWYKSYISCEFSIEHPSVGLAPLPQ